MTALTARIAQSPFGAYPNAHISADLNAYWVDYWPAHQAAATPGAAIALTRTVAVAHPRTVPSGIGRSYMDDYYYRVHLRPAVLNLGTLANAQSRPVEVWNAWPASAQTLTGTPLAGDAGIGVTAPAAFPIAFAPLQARTWSVAVGLDGPPNIAATLTFTFADATQTVTLPITGTRLLLWAWTPDWSNGITERLSWKTDVLQSLTGAEQRRALRLSPRVTWDFDALACGDDRARMQNTLFAGVGRHWGVPIWHDVELLTAPVAAGATTLPTAGGRDYQPGSLLVLIGGDSAHIEAVEVSAVTGATVSLATALQNTWAPGTRMYPARVAQMLDTPKITRETDSVLSVQVQLQSAQPMDYPAAPPTTLYRGLPVLETAPVEGGLSGGWQRVATTQDNDCGIPALIDTAGVGFASRQHAWMCAGRTAHNALRGLLYALAGRVGAVWWPSFSADFRPVAPIGAADSTIRVANVGYARLSPAASMRRDIRIELADGSALHRRIVAATQIDAGTEQLAIDAPLGMDVPVSAVRRISYLTLARLDADDIELHHDTDADGVTECTLPIRALRDDLEAA